MIEIFRHNNKWRIKIVNETLEFENDETMKEIIYYLIETKQNFEPYKHNENDNK